jgi:hybrid cluster-associated redox disulfide protein
MTREKLAETTIEDLLKMWPQTAKIFYQHRMACVGCTVSSFYTVKDAVDVYKLDLTQFLDELMKAIDTKE